MDVVHSSKLCTSMDHPVLPVPPPPTTEHMFEGKQTALRPTWCQETARRTFGLTLSLPLLHRRSARIQIVQRVLDSELPQSTILRCRVELDPIMAHPPHSITSIAEREVWFEPGSPADRIEEGIWRRSGGESLSPSAAMKGQMRTNVWNCVHLC